MTVDWLRNQSMQMEWQKLQPNLIYQLSQEYISHAHKLSHAVETESQLQQYCTLISQGIKGLTYIKEGFQLNTEQDVKLTLELSNLLLQETHNVDMAEMYLSSCRERLLRSTSLFHEKMYVEFMLYYTVPLVRAENYHYKLAVKNVNKLIQTLGELDSIHWANLFKYVRIELLLRQGKTDRVISLLNDLLHSTDGDFRDFLLVTMVNYSLDQYLPIDEVILQQLSAIGEQNIQLYMWKLLLELLVLIHRDENVADKLNQFKDLFSNYKDKLNSNSFSVELSPGIVLTLEQPFLEYKDVKNVLLLFQSCSYLVNCYDKRASFSTKFLPKVRKACEELTRSKSMRGFTTSVMAIDMKRLFYNRIIQLCDFYQSLEAIILHGKVTTIELKPQTSYAMLIQAMKYQLSGSSDIAQQAYIQLLKKKSCSTELRLIALINSYVIYLAHISNAKSTEDLNQLTQYANDTSSHINKIMQYYSFKENHILQCTVILVWIMAHFEPFTKNPMGSAGESDYLNKLSWYYSSNRLIIPETNTVPTLEQSGNPVPLHGSPKLKKALLLHFLLNYLSGSILVHDLQEKCNLSNACFHMCKQQYMPLMRYISGIWNLMNCTLAMRGRDVAITRAKLEDLVKELSHSNFLDTSPSRQNNI